MDTDGGAMKCYLNSETLINISPLIIPVVAEQVFHSALTTMKTRRSSETSCANKRLTLASRHAEVNFQYTSWIHRGNIWTQRQRRGPDHSTGRCSLVREANNIQLSGYKATTFTWLGQNSMQPVASAGQLADFHFSTLLT